MGEITVGGFVGVMSVMKFKKEENVRLALIDSIIGISGILSSTLTLQRKVLIPDVRDVPTLRILFCCAALGRGCAELGRSSNVLALAILSRGLLEKFILLLWVRKQAFS